MCLILSKSYQQLYYIKIIALYFILAFWLTDFVTLKIQTIFIDH